MKHKAPVFTLALLGALALAAISGGLLPCGNAVSRGKRPALWRIRTIPSVFLHHDRACLDENTPPGVNIGDPISATDSDGDTLTYSLEGTDAASFDIDASTGQLITKAALDHEDPQDSDISNDDVVTVRAEDSVTAITTVSVTITVTDVDEPPSAPGVPTVTSDSNVNTSLVVIWYPPDNTGRRHHRL